MKKHKVLSFVLVLCMLFSSLLPVGVTGIEQTNIYSENGLSDNDVIPDSVKYDELDLLLDEKTMPDAVGIETARQRNHIRRLYDDVLF